MYYHNEGIGKFVFKAINIMKENENKKRLKQAMALLNIKIENLKPHYESSDRMNSMYNRMLIEKAIIKNELDNLGRKKGGFLKKLTGFIRPKNKKLISDYFHS